MKLDPNRKEKKLNSIRIKRRLLIFPLTIKGEGRYLEIVYIKQKYIRRFTGPLVPGGYRGWVYEWTNVKFVKKEIYTKYKSGRSIK